MANKTQTIRIESILGGHAPTTDFASPDQFRGCLGIDPSLPITDDALGVNAYAQYPSGLLRPCPFESLSGSAGSGRILWIENHPKSSGGVTQYFTYTTTGSVATFDTNLGTVTGLSDLNDGGTASGNGCSYYDNYIYFARDTTIARYGPLDGTPAFTDDYWVTTLGKTALSDTTYPTFRFGELPNHVLCRHSDGKLYIADVVDNQGTIHYIKTRKTTVEGDTDDGSTYDKVNVGYGLWPTAMESYGDLLVIAFCETSAITGVRGKRAKIAFWDTTSENINNITWVEFPNSIVTALKNANGVLYVASSETRETTGQYGLRISKHIGGLSFETVANFLNGDAVGPGAIDAIGDRLFFGGTSRVPSIGSGNTGVSAVFSIGLEDNKLGQGLFGIGRGADGTMVSALKVVSSRYTNYNLPALGHSASVYAYAGSNITGSRNILWWSQTYRLGQKFKITKIRIPLAQTLATNMTVTPKIYTDNGSGTSYTGGTSAGLSVINSTNYPNQRSVVMRPENLTGENNFWLELAWSGSVLCVVGLPITIEYELIDD